jgi:hypothetical protein
MAQLIQKFKKKFPKFLIIQKPDTHQIKILDVL